MKVQNYATVVRAKFLVRVGRKVCLEVKRGQMYGLIGM
jgi:hypothetical protein